MTLRIGIDFHVVDGKFQGSRTHVIQLFARVVEQAPHIEFFLFLDRPEQLPKLDAAFQARNVHAVRMPACNPFVRLYWHLPRLCRTHQLDAIHTQYVLPAPVSCARMATLHDILFETHPQFFTAFFALRSRLLMRWAARRADHVFTVSGFCKQEISRIYAVPGERISVIHNGVDTRRFSPHGDGASTLARLGLASHGYILSVGRLEPRKNHRTLVEAYARLPADTPPLVLVGQRDFHFAGVFDAIAHHRLEARVRVIEDVTDDELPVLYRHALFLAYPAWAEGFGMPLLEAMASGAAVIACDTTAMPEVVGETGILVAPDDIAGLAAAMRMLLDNADERRRLAAAGLQRSAAFTWDAPASTVVERYDGLASQASPRPSRRLA